MKQLFHEIKINTKGQGLYDFTRKTISWLNAQNIANGILNINILHTSASLVIQENADFIHFSTKFLFLRIHIVMRFYGAILYI